MQQIFGYLSGLVPLVAGYPYIRDILRGKTKPHRGSYMIWTVLGGIALFSQLAKGATWSLLLPGADTLMTITVLVLSIRHGVGGLNKRDMLGLALAGFGLVLWYYTKQPLVALLIVIAVDSVGTVLTILKTYAEPHSETLSSWLLFALAGLLAALAVGEPSLSLLIYPLYFLVANAAVAATILLRQRAQTA